MSNRGPGYAKHPEHTVTVTPFEGRVVIESPSGEVLVDTLRALELREASYPPVFYVPRRDARMDRLARTSHTTHCPFKGDASYFTIAGLPGGENAVWSYERPYDEVASIRDALAFYPDRVVVRIDPA
ncbi:MAG: DUF427 domain-containing protein [Labilithrix sp.]|nr:DUF427 domain-containing protein [Labilithrix sp.]MCW5835393.1 DUF427 domain-containing protein [Labilithrix sp.]